MEEDTLRRIFCGLLPGRRAFQVFFFFGGIKMKTQKKPIFVLTRCAVLSAIAIVLFYFEIPIVPPYKLDFSTLPAILAGFAMGPVSGIAVVLIKNLVHMLSSSSGLVGELADFIMSCAYVIPASLLYRLRKNRSGALVSMIIGTVIMTVVAALVNKFILFPLYGMSDEAIVGLGQTVSKFIDSPIKFILLITAPFNILKGVALSAVTFLLYKRVSPLLHQHIS